MSAKTRSGKVINLRKKKPGGAGTLSFNWGGSHATRPKPARQSPLRARRRRTRAIVGLGMFTILAMLAYGANWISYVPRFSIAGVEVEGAADIPPRLIEAYLEADLFDGAYAFLSRQNIFLYPRESLEESLMEQVPRIRNAKVSREGLLAQAVVVTVEEREPRGRWCDSGGCYYLDKDGFIFAPASLASDIGPYTFMGTLANSGSPIGQTFLPRYFPNMLEFLEKLKNAGYPPLGLSLEGEEDVSVTLDWGFEIRAPLRSDPDKLIRDLELVLASDTLRGKESRLEYIDLRFGNRVYYKFENSEAVQAE